MRIKGRHIFGILIPIVILLLVAAMDSGVPVIRDPDFNEGHSRELLLSLALLSLVVGMSLSNWFRERGLIPKLRFLGISPFLLWGGMRLLSLRAGGDVFSRDTPGAIHGLNHGAFGILFAAVILLMVWMLLILKELIFVQRTKKTARNFYTLIVLMFAAMFLSLFLGSGRVPVARWIQVNESSAAMIISFSLILLYSLINGFRCHWIHFLNRGQKSAAFFLGSLSYGFLLYLVVASPDGIRLYSPVLGVFADALFLFFTIYTGMGLLGILVHLPSAGLMDRRIREIQSLQSLSTTIGSVLDMGELVTKATELSRQVVNADYTWLELKEGDGYRLVGTHGLSQEDVASLPESLKDEVRRLSDSNSNALLINDLLKNKKTREIRRWRKRAGSLLTATIQFQEEELGRLYALSSDQFGFPEDSRDLFRAFADHVGVALKNVRLVQVTIEQQVYHEELRVAHEAQMRLLPLVMPRIEGIHLSAFCITANEIGGDFYDVISVDEDRVDLVIGDVSGRGASAAFYMAEIKGVIQALAPHFTSPKKMLVEINTFLLNHFEADTFATMAYGVYIPSKRQMRLVRAGHPPIGHVSSKGINWLETGGIGLGLTVNDVFEKMLKEKTIRLKPGESVFMYTDGLVEARDSHHDEYGEDRLTEALEATQALSIEELLDEIQNRLDGFMHGMPKHDDVTALALRVL